MENQSQKACARRFALTAGIVALATVTACLCFGLVAALVHNNRNKAAVERAYEQSVYELADNLENIEVNLSKLMVSGEGEVSTLMLTDLYSEAQAAARALSLLPLDAHSAENAEAFLNKVADYGISYQRALVQRRSARSFADAAEDLYVAARAINAQVQEYAGAIARGELDVRKITAAKPYAYRFVGTPIAHNAIEYPELIYDGPFSDGRKQIDYKLLVHLSTVTEQDAEKIARENIPGFEKARVECLGKSEEEPLFELALYGDNASAYALVSEKGGLLVGLSVVRDTGKVLLGKENAQKLAAEYAQKLGYDVQPVWYLSGDGVAYVNLAPIVDGTVVYTDLVKVKVALDNGDILGLEAKGYCLNHADRDLSVSLNPLAVPTLIDSRLSITAVRGALIPLENNEERLCVEVAAEYKGLSYFIYLDADTGKTVRLLRTVDSDQGSLVL